MAILNCQAVVEQVRQLTHDVRELTFRMREPAALPFVAGQYVNFRIPVPGQERPASRLYSINSAPRDSGTLQLLYNFVGGPGTNFLQGLSVGSAVEFKAPMGAFTLREDSTREIVFVATGTGIAPFRSMLREHLPRGLQRKVTLLWSVRYPRDVYYHDEFAALAQQYPNLCCRLSVTQPDGEWQGLRGRVTQLFPEFFPSVDGIEVYCCGNDAMIHELNGLCKLRGDCPIYREKYY